MTLTQDASKGGVPEQRLLKKTLVNGGGYHMGGGDHIYIYIYFVQKGGGGRHQPGTFILQIMVVFLFFRFFCRITGLIGGADHMSHSLNSLEGGDIGDYIGDYYRG